MFIAQNHETWTSVMLQMPTFGFVQNSPLLVARAILEIAVHPRPRQFIR